MKYQSGQSLIELLIALTIFVLGASAVTFLILDAYLADRASRERVEATFLAEQGLEQARLLRNNDWASLISIGSELINNKFTRTITVEDLDSNRKKVSCQVSWQLTENRVQEVNLITYLTNWQAVPLIDCDTACLDLGFSKGSCKNLSACKKGTLLGDLDEYGCSGKKVCCCE